MPISLKKNPSNKGRLEKKDRNPPPTPFPGEFVVLEGTFLGPEIIKHSLIRGVLIQSCSVGAKNLTNYEFCHVQFNSPGQSSKNH